MKKAPLFCLLAFLILLTGCSTQIITDLQVQDLVDVLENETELLCSATIAIRTERAPAEVREFIEKYFLNIGNFRQEEGDGKPCLLADVKLPLLDITRDQAAYEEDLLSIVVSYNDDDDCVFGVAGNRRLFKELTGLIRQDLQEIVSQNDISLEFRLINDTEDAVQLALQNSYLDGQPLLYLDEYILEPGDIAEVRLADVMRDFACAEGYVFWGIVEIP